MAEARRNPFDLSGKVAVVTGSSRGIGRSIAEYLARAGAKVVISARKVEPCIEVVDAIKAEGGQAMAIACNVGRRPEVETLIAETMKAWGRIDILVCNAAINPVYGPMSQLPDDAFEKILSTNVRSNLWQINLVAPQMAERKDGSIIIVSSVAGLRGTALIGGYAVAKAANLQMTRNLAVEWGRKNIRVNAIAPGIIKTDFAKALWDNPQIADPTIQMTPLRRLGDPDDIAGVALFLASDASRYVTGQCIVADGGVTIAGVM